MTIYPKISEKIDGLSNLKPYIKKHNGIEIQMLTWKENDIEKAEKIVKSTMEEIPEIQEITIHPPLKEEFNFEVLSYSNFNLEIDRVKSMIKISKEFNLKINLLYHTRWNYRCWESSGEIQRLRELVDLVENTNVNILIENIFSMVDKQDCAVLKIAKDIDNSHLRVCIDICHLHVQANIFAIEFEEFLKNYLNEQDCKKYVYQIHFAATLDNDGYRKHDETHGKKHRNMEDLKEDYDILAQYGIEDKIIVTEVSEDDYSTRIDQLEEIKMLEGIGE